MIRALARDLGREDHVEGVRVPRHEPGPPETVTDTDYANLLRAPIAARSPANATTPRCGCSATAGRPPRLVAAAADELGLTELAQQASAS